MPRDEGDQTADSTARDALVSERVREYCADMGLKPPDLARVLSERTGETVPEPTAYGYHNGSRPPGRSAFFQVADALGVTSDWLRGAAVYPRWNDEIRRSRLWMQSQARRIQASDMIERTVQLFDLMSQRAPIVGQEWFVAGILAFGNKSLDENIIDYRRFRTGQGHMPLQRVHRIGAFTGLSEQWIIDGDAGDWRVFEDIGPWIGLVELFERHGFTPEEVMQNTAQLRDAIMQQRFEMRGK